MKLIRPVLAVFFIVFSCLSASAQKNVVKAPLFDDDLPGIRSMFNESNSAVGQNDNILRSASFANSMVMGPAGAVNANKKSNTGDGIRKQVAITCTAALIVAAIATIIVIIEDPDSPAAQNCGNAMADACASSAADACTSSNSGSSCK